MKQQKKLQSTLVREGETAAQKSNSPIEGKEAKKLRVLFVCSWYPNKEDAFLGNFIQRHAVAASEYCEVYTLSAHVSQQPKIESTAYKNINETRVYFTKKVPLLSYTKALQRGYEHLKAQELSFDVVHLNVIYPAALFANGLKIPTVISEHFSGYHAVSQYKWTNIRKRVVRKALHKCKQVLPVSLHLGQAIQNFERKIEITKVSNVVDISVFKPLENLKATSGKTHFLHVSTLEERSKNISGILAGFRALQNANTPFHLSIGGDGDVKQLQKDIENVGLEKANYTIFGAQPIEAIAALMQQADCFVLNSNFENQPCVILEALCCGTPVLSSNVGGISEELHATNGILFKSNNHNAFVEALHEFIQKKSTFNATQISAEARAKYSYQAVAKLLHQQYLNVLK